ncbi:MAG: ankyrin repeat domain-containing protein [Solirubrobacteraceae bacterium]
MSDMSDLHEAIRAGDLSAAERLLRAGADPNGKDSLGYPALSVAAGRGEPRLTELLLTAGGDPLLLDTRMGASALHRAAQSGVVDVARLLLDGGAFIDLQAPTHGHTPLIDASWHKQPPMVRFLLERGADRSSRARRLRRGQAPLRERSAPGDLPGDRDVSAHTPGPGRLAASYRLLQDQRSSPEAAGHLQLSIPTAIRDAHR